VFGSIGIGMEMGREQFYGLYMDPGLTQFFLLW
jgi:hypothetical protein